MWEFFSGIKWQFAIGWPDGRLNYKSKQMWTGRLESTTPYAQELLDTGENIDFLAAALKVLCQESDKQVQESWSE